MNKDILSKVRVVDMTEGVAGPYAATLLGDMGAQVVKVERPEGDWQRSAGGGKLCRGKSVTSTHMLGPSRAHSLP